MKAIKEYVAKGIVIAISVMVIVMVVVPTKGPNYCREGIKEKNPSLLKRAVEVESIYTRTIDKKWISSLVFQPKNLNKSEFTVVCNFSSTNYILKSIDVYKGNMADKIRMISVSNYNPITWVQ